MPEVLLKVDLKPETVPPITRGLVEVHQNSMPQTPKEAEWLVKSVKERLYPNWENYERYPEGELPERLYPFYRVICQTPEQAFVADALKPRRAVVDIVMLEDFQREEDERNMNPLVRKLKGLDSMYGWAANVALTGFSVMSLIDAGTHYQHGSPETGNVLTAVGIGFGLASLALEDIRMKIQLGRNQNTQPAIS